ncbi:MAG: hypothetical protein A2Y72_07475 [Chloroflexi bacterium RBG_13_53_26]|nr:MAG: hypothetical protein A2Y72_07475 [Chloroflexi bacterium RBG_13_53_26]
MPEDFHYGGQAVIEGVMMRGQRHLAMAVRCPNGEVVLTTRNLPSVYTGRIRKIPFIRGVIVLVEALVLGIQVLIESANAALGEDNGKISGPLLWGTLIASLGFTVGLFFLAPMFLTRFIIDPHIGDSSILSNLVEGVIRIGIFVIYLALINLMPDIRDIFAYHGAEHKAVNAYEDKAPLEPGAVRKYSTAHVRCGTSFLFAVLIIAIIVFSLLGDVDLWLRIVSRIVLIPVIASLGYEFTRLSARFADNWLMRIFFFPGLLLQRLTTREPSDDKVEVAISALKGVIEADGRQTSG